MLGVVGVYVANQVASHRTPEVASEVCGRAATPDAPTYCVQRRQRPAGLFAGEVDELRIVRRTLEPPSESPRATVLPYPFSQPTNGTLQVSFGNRQIAVQDGTGAEVVLPLSFYRLD